MSHCGPRDASTKQWNPDEKDIAAAGFEFAGSRQQEHGESAAWTRGTGQAKTLLEASIFDMGSAAQSATPEQLAQGAEQYLRQFLGGVQRLRTEYQLSAITKLSLAGAPAAGATWKGRLQDMQTVGVMYCAIVQKRYVVAFHTQAAGDALTPAMRAAIKSIEAAR